MGPFGSFITCSDCMLPIGESQIRPGSLQAFYKALQLPASAGMAELAQRLRFDLSDAFARDFEILAHLLQRVIGRLTDAESLP